MVYLCACGSQGTPKQLNLSVTTDILFGDKPKGDDTQKNSNRIKPLHTSAKWFSTVLRVKIRVKVKQFLKSYL